ncbi:hypothetical protein CXG81DRAFT_21419 [Caulochytrium protostelioides]|uniref:Retrotransposon gag domain-containing protein n=1 Tax=Caulochytrium protostelioides TaxID=1555241 RepID=A0A4P9WXX4_9FUNG|nr:hypothetical protein CXG81DRAFT_21419 [Caulochytrium protostelioides]|eukprot:RKO98331.1 hypothetical protein CXG81DRAFT_21419 [Caulochytrium protostelioides]
MHGLPRPTAVSEQNNLLMGGPPSLRLKPSEDYDGKRDTEAINLWLFRAFYYCSSTDWWQHNLRLHVMPDWTTFCYELKRKLVPVLDLKNAKDKLRQCYQKTSVPRYAQEFENLKRLVPEGTFGLVYAFVFGVKPVLKARIRIKLPARPLPRPSLHYIE